MKRKIWLIILVVCAACARKQTNGLLPFVGTWEKRDSTPIPGDKATANYATKILFDKNNNYYETDSRNGLILKSQGKYLKKTNPDRRYATLVLIPDLEVSGKDTVMPDCRFLDIVNMDDHRFVVKIPNATSINGQAPKQGLIVFEKK